MKPKLTLLMGTLVLVLLGASPAGATLPGKNGPLLISASHGPLPDLPGRPIYISRIYRVGLDGASSSLKIPGYINYAPALSPDGSKLAFVRNPGDQIWTADTDDLTGAVPFTSDADYDGSYRSDPVFAPDGESLLFSTSWVGGPPVSSINRRWLDSSRRLENLVKNPDRYESPDISPDGRMIAFVYSKFLGDSYGESQIRIASDVDSFGEAFPFVGVSSEPGFSPDGRSLAFVSPVDGVRQVFVSRIDGDSLRQLTDDPGDKWNVTFSPDGTKVAYDLRFEGKIVILDLVSGKRRSIDPPGGRVTLAEWTRSYVFRVTGFRSKDRKLGVRVFGPGRLLVRDGRRILGQRWIRKKGNHRLYVRWKPGSGPNRVRVVFRPQGALSESINYPLGKREGQGRVASSSR